MFVNVNNFEQLKILFTFCESYKHFVTNKEQLLNKNNRVSERKNFIFMVFVIDLVERAVIIMVLLLSNTVKKN